MKLFKNCPYQERKQCNGCPLLRKCKIRKVKRIIRKKVSKIDVRRVCGVLVVFIVIMCLIFNISNKNNVKYNTNNENIKNSTNVATEEKQCVVETQKKQTSIVSEAKSTKRKAKTVKKKNETRKKAKISSDGPSEEYYYNISNHDKKIIEKLVYQESRGESLEGKVAVAAVALNRYTSKSKQFDTSSIEAVVTQKYQFADISSVTEKQLATVPECKKAVDMALKGWDPTRKEFSDGAKYFYEPTLVEGYQKEIRQGINQMKIGNHNFHNDFND